MNQRHSLVLTKVSRKYMVVFVLKDSELKVASLGNIYLAIESEETIVGVHPSRVTRVSEVFLSYGVRYQVSYDVSMKLFRVHDDTCSEHW